MTNAKSEFKREQEEQDEKIAAKSLIDDAAIMTEEWIQETSDRQLAKTVAERMEQDEINLKKKMLRDGEAAALKVAMEERSRIREQAQAKTAAEVRDREFARKVILKDIDAECEAKSACENDENVAKAVYATLQDEIYAEKLRKEQEEEYALEVTKKMLMEEADEKYAMSQEKELHAQRDRVMAKWSEQDSEYARVQQELTDQELVEEAKAQDANSEKVARKMQVAVIREELRRRNEVKLHEKLNEIAIKKASADEVVPDPDNINTCDIDNVIDQWANAEASIQDVPDGIVIILQLPYMSDLRVKANGAATVEIEATRYSYNNTKLSVADEKLYNSMENTTYAADFIIEGKGVALNDACLSYTYSKDVGVLYVYVDSVSLSKAENEIKKGVVDKLKNTFKRMFNYSLDSNASRK